MLLTGQLVVAMFEILKSAFYLTSAVAKLTFYVIQVHAIAITPTITTRTADDHCFYLQIDAK